MVSSRRTVITQGPLKRVVDAADQAADAVSLWNITCPEGTSVAVRLVEGGPEHESVTRSAAWVSQMETKPVVLVAGRWGTWPLALVRPLRDGECLPRIAHREEAPR